MFEQFHPFHRIQMKGCRKTFEVMLSSSKNKKQTEVSAIGTKFLYKIGTLTFELITTRFRFLKSDIWQKIFKLFNCDLNSIVKVKVSKRGVYEFLHVIVTLFLFKNIAPNFEGVSL